MAQANVSSRAKQAVEIEGVKYDSRTAAAKALVAAGKSITETAQLTGVTYQTVYAYTKGGEKTAVRRARYRILALGKSGQKTVSEIATKVGVTTSKVVALLKKEGIKTLTKEEAAAMRTEKKSNTEKTEKTSSQKSTKTPVVKKKSKKVQKVESVDETLVIDTEIPVDESAMTEAMADMVTSD
jgi:transposase